MTKWFFALSEASLGHPGHDWEEMILTAVTSARINTSLQPHFLYDGAPNELTTKLQNLGVTIVYQKLSYLPNILGRWHEIGLPPDPMRLAIVAGAYLRTDIPRLDLEDEFVLYTDCDVMFLADPQIERFRPAYFACAPQRFKNDLSDMNSGVMVMNLPAMRREAANFAHYIVNNFERFGAHDQDALREYYAGRYDTLPLELNWKPYWGYEPAARIVHFHGPKPSITRRLLADPSAPGPTIWRELFAENRPAYAVYLRMWDEIGSGGLLRPCNGLWGSATIIDSDPASSVVPDAVYFPLRPDIFLDTHKEWGIYDSAGTLVDDAAYYRLPAKALIGQSRHLPIPPTLAAAAPGQYVYGGPVILHYGHFLTAALPRLWQIVRGGLPPDAKIVCHSHQTPAEWFERDYVRTIFGQLGLTPDHFIQFAEPTRIARLHTPRPALEEQNFAHRVFRELCLRVGRPFQAPAGERTVYMSKTRITNGTFRLLNEAVIEDVMRENGIEVVYPETLPFTEQIGLMCSSKLVIGTVGSAHHTSLFCERPPRMIGMAYGPQLNANYALIDALAGNRTQYMYPTSLTERATDTATFSYEASDPAALAHALIRSI